MIPQHNNPLGFLDSLMKTETFICPCGNEVTIQEMDGDTEATIVTNESISSGLVFDVLMKAIIKSFNKEPLTEERLTNMRSRTKSFIALRYRIMAQGPEMEFSHTFYKEDNPIDFEEDLQIFNADFSREPISEFIQDPETEEPRMIKNPEYSDKACKPYLQREDYVEFVTSSQKTLRFQHLTSKGERFLLQKDIKDIKLTDQILARYLQVKDLDGIWHLIPAFKKFNSMDMKEIRGQIELYDSEFDLMTTVTNPKNNKVETISLFSKINDFFFPRGI